MKYFVDPYKTYHEKLSSLGSIDTSSVTSGVESAKNSISKLSSSVDDSKWSEMGIDELKSNVLPSLLSNHDTLESNVGILSQIVNLATGSLLTTLTSLKAEDERLDALSSEYSALLANPEYEKDSEGKPTTTLTQKYKADLAAKKQEMEECEEKCKALVREADGIIEQIKSLDSSVSDFSIDIGSLNTTTSTALSVTLGQAVKDGKMLEIEFNGRKFYIANTEINALDYEAYIQKCGAYQTNDPRLDSRCAIIAQYYAVDMMRGTYTSRDVMGESNAKTGVSNRMSSGMSSENKDDVLKYIYDEISNGRLTTLQVTRKAGGGRHVVTVVGFDSSVKSYEDLTPDNILVLDCVDGKIQTLGQSRSEGGHERDLYAQKNSKGIVAYFASGPTDEFIEKEAENEDWKASHGVRA